MTEAHLVIFRPHTPLSMARCEKCGWFIDRTNAHSPCPGQLHTAEASRETYAEWSAKDANTRDALKVVAVLATLAGAATKAEG